MSGNGSVNGPSDLTVEGGENALVPIMKHRL